jgi:catechol 2,3-dioxygenase-like lactoylglutathione lyase family enzyme
MNLNFHSTVLFVKDIEKSKHFYCNILSQEIDSDFGNNISFKTGLSLWQIPERHILNDNFYNKYNSNKSLEIYFETETIDEIVEFINSKNIKKHHELIEESWGQKTIRIYDPDNNLIEIGEKLKSFIKRMYRDGLSIEQINRKSGVQINLISKYIKE